MLSINSPCGSSLVPCDMIEKLSSPSTPFEHHVELHELVVRLDIAGVHRQLRCR